MFIEKDISIGWMEVIADSIQNPHNSYAYANELENIGVYESLKEGSIGLVQGVSNHINVLLVGLSQTGKSTIIETIKHPQKGTISKGFSDTKHEYDSVIMHDKYRNLLFQLNFIDTLDLQDVPEGRKSRLEAELSRVTADCVKKNITSLNLICFVSRAGKTHPREMVVFDTVQKFLGDRYSNISMMVLTHCDEFSDVELKQFERAIHDHKNSKPILEYCKLGIARYGAMNFTSLAQFLEKDIQQAVVRSKLSRIETMRNQFIDKILSCAYKEISIYELQAIYDERNLAYKTQIDKHRQRYIMKRALEVVLGLIVDYGISKVLK